MRMKIGEAEVEGRHPGRAPEYDLLLRRHREAAGRKPFLVYRWDCRLAPDGNPAPPARIAIAVHVTGAWPDPQTGTLDAAAGEARMAAFFDRIDPTSGVGHIFLAQALPPVQFAVPWPAFASLMSAAVTFHLLAWPDYVDLLVGPTTPPPIAPVLVSLPMAVRFQAIVTARCLPVGAPADPAVGAERLKDVLLRRTDLDPEGRAFLDTYLAEQAYHVEAGGPLPSPEEREARSKAGDDAREVMRRRLARL